MKELLKQRGVDTLYHFTRAENLESIFKYGLFPRKSLEKRCINCHINDYYRFDNCLDAVSMSLEFPNYKMFFKLRMENSDAEWAVLKLDARILCNFLCAYCWTNAGDSMMSSIPIEQRMGEEAFLKLFQDYLGYPSRSTLSIPDCYPTNPQAEILVFGEVPVSYIDEVCFENIQVLDKYRNVITGNVKKSIDNIVFSPRKDWRLWR